MERLMIVTLGPEGPFERLTGWVSRWSAQYADEWQVQSLDGASLVSFPAVAARVLYEADLVVCDAAAEVLGPVLLAGHLPVVVPRDPALGETDDDAQLRRAGELAAAGRIEQARTEDAFLAAAVSAAYLPRPREASDPAPAPVGD